MDGSGGKVDYGRRFRGFAVAFLTGGTGRFTAFVLDVGILLAAYGIARLVGRLPMKDG